jgi:hypothetical protein
MISTNLNFLEFLKTLEGKGQAETILAARRESYAAQNVKPKRSDKATSQKLNEYLSDLRSFLHFVSYSDNGGMSWPEAFLASSEWKNTQRFRFGNLLEAE